MHDFGHCHLDLPPTSCQPACDELSFSLSHIHIQSLSLSLSNPPTERPSRREPLVIILCCLLFYIYARDIRGYFPPFFPLFFFLLILNPESMGYRVSAFLFLFFFSRPPSRSHLFRLHEVTRGFPSLVSSCSYHTIPSITLWHSVCPSSAMHYKPHFPA
ncbi:hypothetical protein ASPZODRAFT_1213081 [Penicilliopsis zonata CBS 506.65]|uniref:Uncharacterized protein n=1 Tax=Penicilliopsis zonata CBS 506.65 TaxID=1073090 RepID=A0A1L9S7H0_9EURO|nr:hypothetical protein ASPZODRAFT_1213081 [Penicilliopsis zonata CBS 506.65]OJJ43083.1 hypothetical protein ASPZODRAFT_1213081 [Penicilliopsis zonata CBS 506.65]